MKKPKIFKMIRKIDQHMMEHQDLIRRLQEDISNLGAQGKTDKELTPLYRQLDEYVHEIVPVYMWFCDMHDAALNGSKHFNKFINHYYPDFIKDHTEKKND